MTTVCCCTAGALLRLVLRLCTQQVLNTCCNSTVEFDPEYLPCVLLHRRCSFEAGAAPVFHLVEAGSGGWLVGRGSRKITLQVRLCCVQVAFCAAVCVKHCMQEDHTAGGQGQQGDNTAGGWGGAAFRLLCLLRFVWSTAQEQQHCMQEDHTAGGWGGAAFRLLCLLQSL
jgi:hypothetical protein